MKDKGFPRALKGAPTRLILCLAACALYAALSESVLSANAMRYLLQIFLYIALGEAWNLLSGFAGMTSLGQQLYIGLGGYAMAVLTSTYRLGLGWGLLVGAVTGLVVALLLSRVLFRMWGMYFAIATWVAAEAAEKIFLNWRFVNQGGGMTVTLAPYPQVGQIHLMAFALCVVSIAAVYAIMRSRLGLGLICMRDDAEAAATIGVNLSRSRLIVYAFAAVLTALAGGVFFVNKGVIYPESGYSVGWTVSIVFVCIIGGTGTVAGPVAGAVLYVLLRELLAHYPGWSNIILGLITIVVILYMPEGIVGALQKKLGHALFSMERRPDAGRGKGR